MIFLVSNIRMADCYYAVSAAKQATTAVANPHDQFTSIQGLRFALPLALPGADCAIVTLCAPFGMSDSTGTGNIFPGTIYRLVSTLLSNSPQQSEEFIRGGFTGVNAELTGHHSVVLVARVRLNDQFLTEVEAQFGTVRQGSSELGGVSTLTAIVGQAK